MSGSQRMAATVMAVWKGANCSFKGKIDGIENSEIAHTAIAYGIIDHIKNRAFSLDHIHKGSTHTYRVCSDKETTSNVIE